MVSSCSLSITLDFLDVDELYVHSSFQLTGIDDYKSHIYNWPRVEETEECYCEQFEHALEGD